MIIEHLHDPTYFTCGATLTIQIIHVLCPMMDRNA